MALTCAVLMSVAGAVAWQTGSAQDNLRQVAEAANRRAALATALRYPLQGMRTVNESEHYEYLLQQFFEVIGEDQPAPVAGITSFELQSIRVHMSLLKGAPHEASRIGLYVMLCELTEEQVAHWHPHILAANLKLGMLRLGAFTTLPEAPNLMFVTSVPMDEELNGAGLARFVSDLFRDLVDEQSRLQKAFAGVTPNDRFVAQNDA
jgi:hypothetical protein